jgi:hypothetical protein
MDGSSLTGVLGREGGSTKLLCVPFTVDIYVIGYIYIYICTPVLRIIQGIARHGGGYLAVYVKSNTASSSK